MIKQVIIYLLIMNFVAFISMGIDKYKAKHNKWRISENTLITLAALGGSIGSYLGMQTFRHKTKHIKFKYGVPIIFVVQVVLLFILL